MALSLGLGSNAQAQQENDQWHASSMYSKGKARHGVVRYSRIVIKNT
jgi:hypothetical protein